MTKEKVIKRLQLLTDYEYGVDLEALETAIKLLLQTNWIPCSERLLEEKDYRACQENLDGAVLWCTERGMIGLGWYYESTKAWADIYDEEIEKRWGKIMAWMPLPEPIKAEGEQ